MKPGDDTPDQGARTRPPDLCARRTEWLRGGGGSSDVVMSSRVRLARNLAGFPFMPKADRTAREQILRLCRRQIESARIAPRLMWIDLHTASKAERNLLVERQLISRPHARGRLSNGTGSSGEPRAVAVGLPDEQIAISVNEEDHLRLQVIRSGLDLAEAYRIVDRTDDAIEAGIEYAYSPRFGYLTACPTNVGTGARFSVMLHLPGLVMTGEFEKVKNAADDMGLAVRGFYGEGSEAAGDFFQLSNQVTLGQTEQQLLEAMQDQIVPKVVEYERGARDILLGKRRRKAEDEIFRALGTLRSARLLSVEEAMNLLSRVRLGVTLKLIDEVDLETVGRLLLMIQNAHLEQIRPVGPADRHAARADFVREVLSGEGG